MTPACAQSGLVSQLSMQVCRCMETTDRVAPPAEQARECVRLVGMRHKRALQELGLDPENPADISLLSERMADLLSRNCPVLTTLRFDDYERELRWSDGNTASKRSTSDLRYQSPKGPPADDPDGSVSEPPGVWRMAGRVVGRPGRGTLRLLLTDGNIQSLEYPSAVSRRVELTEGQMIIAVCDRQWRKRESGGTVALVVRSIE